MLIDCYYLHVSHTNYKIQLNTKYNSYDHLIFMNKTNSLHLDFNTILIFNKSLNRLFIINSIIYFDLVDVFRPILNGNR